MSPLTQVEMSPFAQDKIVPGKGQESGRTTNHERKRNQ